MKKIIVNMMAVALLAVGMVSCSSDELDPNSIFNTNEPVRNELENWLLQNFTYPYNVEVTYRLNDIETDNRYTVVPADSAKAAKLAKLVKFMWFDAYDEVAGQQFLKQYAPRLIMMVGSGLYHSEGTVVLGYASGSIKIALCNVNNLNDEIFHDINTLNEWYLSTLHHEFQHILNQKIAFDKAFEQISKGDYVSGSWYLQSNATAYEKGFVRNYAMQEASEDFAETMSDYVVYSDQKFEQIMMGCGGANSVGWQKIQEKIAFIRNYMLSAYDIDIDKLRASVQRRASELGEIDLEHLN